jgi:hypothetical protein
VPAGDADVSKRYQRFRISDEAEKHYTGDDEAAGGMVFPAVDA